MTDHPFDRLQPRGKPPTTVRALETWIQQAEQRAGIGARRLGWMVASSVVIAAIQRARHDDGNPRFLVKGGAYLELRLGLKARATKDVDTLFRGRFDDFLEVLDQALTEPFDNVSLRRTEPVVIEVPGRRIKPRRFDVILELGGRTWRRITLEVSPDEGHAGARVDNFHAPSLAHFGLSTPPTTAGLVIDYQVAQKFHACTDPHTPDRPNDRVRDVVDLHLLKLAFYADDDNLASLVAACRDLFAARAQEAASTGEVAPRSWPPTIVAHQHWRADYATYSAEVSVAQTLERAVGELNAWIADIEGQPHDVQV